MSKGLKYLLGAGVLILGIALGFLAAGPARDGGGQLFTVAADLDPQYLALPGSLEAQPPGERIGEPAAEEPWTGVEQASIPSAEGRALWVPRWSYKTAEDVRTIVRKAAGANFNIILFQVRGNGDAYYSSVYEPWADRLTGTLG
ncbi:MAG TPA: hypothetical protein ENO24_09000, partial [Chloroflexi bacterium]|nr:hypothetical protein [Chloroflexota bacterium]